MNPADRIAATVAFVIVTGALGVAVQTIGWKPFRIANHVLERAWDAMIGRLPGGTPVRATASVMRCAARHASTVPVEDLLGERVAVLCRDCDEQLPADWRPSFTDTFFDPNLVSGRRLR